MNVHVEFSPQIEQALIRRATAAGMDVPTYVRTVVTEEITHTAADGEDVRPGTHQQRMAKLREIISRIPPHGHVDDSRESIYAGRGELAC